jgi:hypothetical protein
MGRSEARLQFRIWDDLDVVTPPAKLLYAVLLTDETVNFAGIGRLAPELWARKAGLDVAAVTRLLDELAATGFVVTDDYTREILVRTMIRSDRVAEVPNLLKCALGEASRVRSPRLARVLAAELRKLPPAPPDKPTKRGRYVYPDPHAVAEEIDPGPSGPPPGGGSGGSPDERRMGSADPINGWDEAMVSTDPIKNGPADTIDGSHQRMGCADISPDGDLDGEVLNPPVSSSVGGSVLSAQPLADRAPEPAPEAPAKAARGSRLPDDFKITFEMGEWARTNCPGLDWRRETAAFVDYWRGIPGARGRKLDWPATWRNWMRKAHADLARRSPTARRRNLDDKVIEAGALFDELADLADTRPPNPHLRALPGG